MASASTGRLQLDSRGACDDEAEALPDDELLGHFLSSDDPAAEAAFAALVTRHGPMVMGVCRHTLGRLHDAEDAFQATFLVLARKASTIQDRRCLARWLYEVAYHVAIRCRARASAVHDKERQGVEMSAAAPDDRPDLALGELRPALHEEIHRLPENYRAAVVLCYLEGRTNEEAARLLRCPVGTVKGRLMRAREMLRSRLTRRGLALSAMFLMTGLSRREVFAEVVPSDLVERTARIALLDRHRGPGSVPHAIDHLADDVPTPAPPLAVGLKALLIALATLVIASTLFWMASGQPPRFDATSMLRSLTLPPGGQAAAAAPGNCH